MFQIQSILVTVVAASVFLIVYMELRLKFRTAFKPAMTESIVGSIIVLVALGAVGSIFSGWAKVAALFALPIFLPVGVIVGLLYRRTDRDSQGPDEEPPNQAL